MRQICSPDKVWEGSFILDIFEQEDKEPRPEILHGDTQAQSSTIFGMAYLLGIELMPRIRNWKDLKLSRPSQDAHYTHINELFSDTVDWDLIETHLPDMLRVVLSVTAGMIRPSTILRKLGTYSRKNKLYQAFRELGNVVRTEFLLHLLGDPELRSTLQSAMNKSEAFNGFAKWVLFGGEGVIAENRREEQRKIIKFNHLVANCVILYNVFVVSKELQKLALEGREFDEQAVAALSPYIRHHINRFGHYQLDLTRHSPPIEYDLPIPTKKRQEKLAGQATPTRRKKKPKKKRKKTVARQMKLFSAEEDTREAEKCISGTNGPKMNESLPYTSESSRQQLAISRLVLRVTVLKFGGSRRDALKMSGARCNRTVAERDLVGCFIIGLLLTFRCRGI